jgi:hypothetical protein
MIPRTLSILPFLLLLSACVQGQESTATGLRIRMVEGRAVELRFEGNGAHSYRLESSDDLLHWSPFTLEANVIGPGRFESFDAGARGMPQRYYRVRPGAVDTSVPLPERVGRKLAGMGEGTGADTHAFTVSWPEALLVPVNDPAYGAGTSAGNRLTPTQILTARAEGLAAWRRAGNHGNCAGCHSPDAFDLALIGYSDADITRRALDHVDAADAAKIVTLIKTVRQDYGINRPLHPLNFRPLQPGHEVLPGATHSARDLAFANYLNNEVALIWAKDRIESRAQAKAAQAQLLALDLRKLRTGIPFDRWSEDHTRGAAHLSASEWLPMMGMQPKDGKASEWYALHDAYLADPVDANFWAYYTRIDELLMPVEPAGYERGQAWSLLKYKSVQIAQHMLRHQSLPFPNPLTGMPGTLVANRNTVLARNPIFRTGDHVRRFPLHTDAANPSTVFPPYLAPTVPTTQAALRDQNDNFLRVWFWMGWVYDPAMLLSDSLFATVEGDYLYASLLQHYKVHHAFVIAMTSVAKANATPWFGAPGTGVAGHGKWAAFNPFMVLHHIERNRSEPPAGDARRAMHDRMYSNTARLWIYLVQEDLELTGQVFSRELVRGSIRFARAWLNDTEPAVDHTALDAVIADIETRLNAAQELRTNFGTPDLSDSLPF